MAIHDKDPERRNLVVTSLGFIIYYLGEGRLVSDQLALPLVNIKFENTAFLAGFAWVMLIWFGWRYWQTREERQVRATPLEINRYFHNEMISKIIKAKTGLTVISDMGTPTSDFKTNKWNKWTVNYKVEPVPEFDDHGNQIGMGSPNKQLELTGWTLLVTQLKCFVYSSFTKPAFISHYAPYLLFFTAVLIGAYPYGFKYVG